MRCIRPIRAGYTAAGSVTYSSKLISKELVTFEFECRKCLPCRLNAAREKSVRAYHEAQMHEESIFLTLTYDNEHLKSPWLQYIDFQLFMKSLREKVTRGITDKETKERLAIRYYVTGEYGEENKRPHWHAIIFNYRPKDAEEKYKTDRGEQVWKSKEIRDLWKKGDIEFGSVTIDSASYVTRYAAKKLVHGRDQEHRFHPIHKPSTGRAIGRTWIEKHYQHVFSNGFIVLPNGSTTKIPRYYEDWYRKNHFDSWLKYVSTIKQETIKKAQAIARKEELEYLSAIGNYNGRAKYPLTRAKVKETVLKQKFKRLQERLKL